MYTTLISKEELQPHLHHPDWVILDCRFVLNDPESGWRAYQKSHLPQARYAHLEADLSGKVIPQKTGRHPLPSPESLAQTFSKWGIEQGVQVVAYDDSWGAMASRLWWLLRWLGHEQVAVLDGGWQHWQSHNLPTTAEIPKRLSRAFVAKIRSHGWVDANQVLEVLEKPDFCILDARTAERYRGENETIDPIAGHIPHALSAPFAENIDSQGRFLSSAVLRKRFQKLLGEVSPHKTISYCGSGVTACHNLLALAHAGLGEGKLYAGSWSEWITDPNRPITQGKPSL